MSIIITDKKNEYPEDGFRHNALNFLCSLEKSAQRGYNQSINIIVGALP